MNGENHLLPFLCSSAVPGKFQFSGIIAKAKEERIASSACNLPAILHGEEWGDVACFQGGNLDL